MKIFIDSIYKKLTITNNNIIMYDPLTFLKYLKIDQELQAITL